MANELQRRNDLFGDVFDLRNWMNDNFFAQTTPTSMKTDIAETEHSYRLKMDLPGFPKDKIHVNYANNILTVTGTRDSFADEADHEGNLLHSERHYGQMSREFRLPDVDINNAKAKYEDGVLILDLPKLTDQANNQTSISID